MYQLNFYICKTNQLKNKDMKTYKFEVWYRYRGGDEKDFEIVTVEAKDVHEAEILALSKFRFSFKAYLKS